MKRPWRFIMILLMIELLDELVYGLREAAWPLIRVDLGLSYTEIGLLISVPGLLGSFIEPALGILGDTSRRRALILGGGCVFTASIMLAAASGSFLPLLLAFILLFPASGAYVGLSQAVLMDLEPHRHEHNMARWTLAGSVGVFLGPLLLSGAAALGGGWRMPMWGLAALAGLILLLSWWGYHSIGVDHPHSLGENRPFLEGLKNAGRALTRVAVLRWLVLLEFSDLMLDVLYSYLALYLVDVGGISPAEAGLGVAIWTGVGLLGDFLLIPLLERVAGLTYLRVSALLEFILFPAFLLVPWLPAKLAVLGLLGFFNSGWYSILQGQVYTAMPGQSGAVMTLGNITGFVGKLIPLVIGLAAQQFGLGTAMWFLWAGPIALILGLPKARVNPGEVNLPG